MKNNIWNIISISAIVLIVGILSFTSMKNKEQENVNMIVAVHVKGEVNNPGYYELSYGSRVKDAIDKAGGATENADLNSVNLAEKLRDGDELIILSKGVATSSKGAVSAVNINTAEIGMLCTLEGIGESTAKAIVDYRTKNGAFKKIEDLKKVDGIGESKFNAIKDKITV